jgi:membrane-associated phospholipid phosphatase
VFGWEKLQRVSTDILFSHFIAGIVRNGGKMFIGRARPREDVGAYEFGEDGTSLPSGHASSIFQIATVLSKHIDYWPASVVLYGLATSVAIERVETREHWASDVWIGAMNGRAIAQIIMNEHDEKGVLVVPTVTPETNSVGLFIEFDF